MSEAPFEVFAQVDLSAFFLGRDDFDFDRRVPRCVDALVLMEDRAPDFFLSYRGEDEDDRIVPLSRHGISFDAWRARDLRRLVDIAHDRRLRVFFGAWMHTSAWVLKHHPELLLVNCEGEAWTREGDLNPMRTLQSGDEEGLPFGQYVATQYARLARDFGFDGFFVGDGGLGFRQFGHDYRGLAYFDFAPSWLHSFGEAGLVEPEPDCPLRGAAAEAIARDVPAFARHVLARHAREWVEWNVAQWAGFYSRLALAVHATHGELMAYNVMNYGPVLARLHGADYRKIAEAGLDYLVFQTYDYAWGQQTSPLAAPSVSGKQVEENLYELLLTRAHLGETRTKLVFTTGAGDAVEGWRAPIAHSLGEAHAYGDLSWHAPEGAWARAADGTVVTWANRILPSEWSLLDGAFASLSARDPTPRGLTLLWDEARVAETAWRLWSEGEGDAYAYQLPAREAAVGNGAFLSAIAPADHAEAAPGPVADALPEAEEVAAAEKRAQPFEGLLELRPIRGLASPSWAWRLRKE